VQKKLEEYEGRYNHMYLDSKGKVTIGVGHLIASKGAVATIKLYKMKNNHANTTASLIEKKDEYDNVVKQKKNNKASWYKKFTKLVMKDTDINTQRDKHIATFYSELSGAYCKAKGYTNNFDDMPEEVQLALFDMIFNLGEPKLRRIFTNFNNAIKQEKWDEAAKQSNRPDVNAARNSYVKTLLNKAHTNAKAKKN
jgi:GH24 family phage-related lysozyme (muramidase)